MTQKSFRARVSRWILFGVGAGLALSLLAATPAAPVSDEASPTSAVETPPETADPGLPPAAPTSTDPEPAPTDPPPTPDQETVTSAPELTSTLDPGDTPTFAILPSQTEPPLETSTQTLTAPPSTDDPAETQTPAPLADTDTPQPSPTVVDPSATASETPSPTDAASPTLAPTMSATPSTLASETPFPTDAANPTLEPTPAPTMSATPSTLASETPSPTDTASPTLEPTFTPTMSATPSAPPTEVARFSPGDVVINEVAWAGTQASANDEWIELWNTSPDPINLDGWRLTDGGDLDRLLAGSIDAYGFYLMERTGDSTVADIPADFIYTGSLNNGGEALTLSDPSGQDIDTANVPGGPWPAGSASPRSSMERHGALDLPANWGTFSGTGGFGTDADGNPILGTPRQANSPSLSPSLTPTPTAPSHATPYPEGALRINEAAWAGTLASSSDEWIELFNPSAHAIPLAGWTLTDGNDIHVSLQGLIEPGAYFLLERTDDGSVADIAADQTYAGGMSNNGEALSLIDPTGSEIDSANADGGPWPAGSASSRASMERRAGLSWGTFTGYYGIGHDAEGHAILGTPGAVNSVLFPTPTPTWIPGRVVINELLVRPHYDWEGAGGVTTADEFIELYNRGPQRVNLRGWVLDDIAVGGSAPYELPAINLEPGEYVALFRTRTHIALNDGGDSVRLSAPDGHLIDKVSYLRIRAYNLAYGRLPDGDDILAYGLWPTPGEDNLLFVEPTPTATPTPLVCPQPRVARRAALAFRPEPCP